MLNRRNLLGVGLASGGALLGNAWGMRRTDALVQQARFHGDSILGVGTPEKVWHRQKFVDSPVMDNQLLYVLGLAAYGLTDVGEVLHTASRISPGDEASWFDAFCETAARVQTEAETAERGGHEQSAGAHYRRAGAYWRTGLMRYAGWSDPRMSEAVDQACRCHDRALQLQGYDSAEVEIPYERSVLFGRVYFSPHAVVAPTLLLFQGLHAWPEDTMWVTDGALARGYHVLMFHGPGQGVSLRHHDHPFRPDWERVVGPVIDFSTRYPRIDQGRLLLMGLSFGGHLATRAACFEPRLRMLIANPGVLSWGAAMLRHFEEIPGLMALHGQGPAMFDRAIAAVGLGMPDAAWYFADVTRKHGVDSAHALLAELAKYDNTPHVANVSCPTLILDGDAEDATPGQSQALFERLTCPKELVRFATGTGSEMHCQGGGTRLAEARLFDTLHRSLRG